jgi:hypothetical protein
MQSCAEIGVRFRVLGQQLAGPVEGFERIFPLAEERHAEDFPKHSVIGKPAQQGTRASLRLERAASVEESDQSADLRGSRLRVIHRGDGARRPGETYFSKKKGGPVSALDSKATGRGAGCSSSCRPIRTCIRSCKVSTRGRSGNFSSMNPWVEMFVTALEFVMLLPVICAVQLSFATPMEAS